LAKIRRSLFDDDEALRLMWAALDVIDMQVTHSSLYIPRSFPPLDLLSTTHQLQRPNTTFLLQTLINFHTHPNPVTMPFGWGESEQSYDQVYNNDNFEENKSSLGHEVVAGGAAFAGFKAFEDHQRKEGPSLLHLPLFHNTPNTTN
jgi:hypothetical protein